MSAALTIASASEADLPPEERRCIHGAHVDHQAETDVTLTADEAFAVDEWASDLLDDHTPIYADSCGCAYTKDPVHNGGIYPAPVAPSFGFLFWAGLFFRALWPVVVILSVMGAFWLLKGRP